MNEEGSIMRAEHTAVARITDLEGFEQFDRGDLVMPRLRLVQATSRDIPDKNKRLGQWWDAVNEEAYPTLDAVILRYSRTRAYFDGNTFDKSALLCRSSDGRVPDLAFAGKFADLCEHCPNAQWGSSGKPPVCKLGYTFLAINAATDMPFIMTWSGTAVKRAKQLITAMLAKRRPAYAILVHLSSRYVDDQRGSWYIPAFSLELLDNEKAEHYRQAYLAYANVELEADEDVLVTDTEEVPF